MGKLAQIQRSRSAIAPAQNTAIRFYDDAGNEIAVTQQDVLQFICPKANAQEVTFFMELCRAQRLNPFLREAYLVKYGNNPASMITAEIVFERRANAHPDYEGMESGIVFMTKDGAIERREGTATYKAAGETLLGGWARVHRKGRTDAYAEVSLDEYNKNQSVWKTMPGVMIHKCAKGVALRLAFPTDFQGMYLEEEMGGAPSVIEVHDAVIADAEQEGPTAEEKAELRALTDACVAAGCDQGVASWIWEQYQKGGMDAARSGAKATIASQRAVDEDTGEILDVEDADIDF